MEANPAAGQDSQETGKEEIYGKPEGTVFIQH